MRNRILNYHHAILSPKRRQYISLQSDQIEFKIAIIDIAKYIQWAQTGFENQNQTKIKKGSKFLDNLTDFRTSLLYDFFYHSEFMRMYLFIDIINSAVI